MSIKNNLPHLYINIADNIKSSGGVQNIIAGSDIVKNTVFSENIMHRFVTSPLRGHFTLFSYQISITKSETQPLPL